MRTVIIPTLNEEENIGLLIDSIYQHLGEEGTSVIVVDDDSSDQTQDVVKEKAAQHRNVRLIVRKGERGLSTAVRRGAEEVPSGPLVVMDADFSHRPRYLPKMFGRLEQGYDIVVGSRYTKGGSIIGWTGHRIAVSIGATYLARILLRVPVKDPMSGFVGCKNPETLRQGIKHADFKFLLEVIAKNPHLRVTEVPITFQDRTRGKSKLGSGTILQYIGLIVRLLLHDD